jgi:tRNA 2-thiouridine synthesizing protein E
MKEEIERKAKDEGIELTDAHWDMLKFIRSYYAEYGNCPNFTLIARRFGKNRIYQLFRKGVFQAYRIAGIEPFTGCV